MMTADTDTTHPMPRPWRARTAFPGVLLILPLLASPMGATADDTALQWYNIEVVIFSNEGDPGTETWPLEPGTPDTHHALPLLPRQQPDRVGDGEIDKALEHTPFQELAQDDYQLTRTSQRLFESDHYTLLHHVAWRQPGLNGELALPVHIQGGLHWFEDDDDTGVRLEVEPSLPTGAEWAEELSRVRSESGEDDEALNRSAELRPYPVMGPPPPLIDGTLRLIQTRYLHAELDLLYRNPMPDPRLRAYHRPGLVFHGTNMEDARPSNFRIVDSRRMRSGEIHYIDHPLVGILIFVNPYELADVETIEEEDEPPTAPLSAPGSGGIIQR